MKADFYCTVMFPYPSGSGLHLGHTYNFAPIDSYCRWLRLKGTSVFSAAVTAGSYAEPSAVAKKFRIERFAS